MRIWPTAKAYYCWIMMHTLFDSSHSFICSLLENCLSSFLLTSSWWFLRLTSCEGLPGAIGRHVSQPNSWTRASPRISGDWSRGCEGAQKVGDEWCKLGLDPWLDNGMQNTHRLINIIPYNDICVYTVYRHTYIYVYKIKYIIYDMYLFD